MSPPPEVAHPSVQEVSFVDKTDPYLTHAKAYNQKYVCICQVLVSDKGWLSKQLALREITHSDDAHNKRHQHTADVTPSPDPLNQQKSTYHEKSSQFAVEPARQWKDNKFVRGDVFPGFFTGTWTTTLTQGAVLFSALSSNYLRSQPYGLPRVQRASACRVRC
ncbi:hypothetical protein Bbelb_413080 [Branchiostoma belcheri]|nr:hypothetical protein Bbelb_413080 [Branchiostoma belcheri]